MDSVTYQDADEFEEWLERKRLGAFYTPSDISDLLSNWAIHGPGDNVLEPSFGGCGFLESAINRLKSLGAEKPEVQLYGCDIDDRAFEHLSDRVGNFVDLDNFRKANFLESNGHESWPEAFDAVVGNPPYLSYHHIDEDVRAVAQDRLKEIGFDIPLKSSTWAYFVSLSLRFLIKGGRIAWVLPGSVLQTQYAGPLRQFLTEKFERIHAFQIQERLFLYEGTDEQTIILLGDGYRPIPTAVEANDIPLIVCREVSDLPKAIEHWERNPERISTFCGTAVQGVVSQSALERFNSVAELTECVDFGEIANVRIGLVTGDNKFFLLAPTVAEESKLKPVDLRHTLGKFIDTPGVSFKKSDQRDNESRDRRCLLVHSDTQIASNRRVQAYLETFPEERISEVSTFKKRAVWARTDDGNIPHAFFPVMHHLGPKLVLNHSRVNCTNTIHRVYFSQSLRSAERKLISISMLTTFSQLSAEFAGRKYGSGVLKHEPREAEKIKLLLPTGIADGLIERRFNEIDRLLRSGEHERARGLADQFIMRPVLGDDFAPATRQLSKALMQVRKHRHPGKRTKKKYKRKQNSK